MDGKTNVSIYVCLIKQADQCVRVPVPYDSLEYFVKLVVAYNNAVVVVEKISTIEF